MKNIASIITFVALLLIPMYTYANKKCSTDESCLALSEAMGGKTLKIQKDGVVFYYNRGRTENSFSAPPSELRSSLWLETTALIEDKKRSDKKEIESILSQEPLDDDVLAQRLEELQSFISPAGESDPTPDEQERYDQERRELIEWLQLLPSHGYILAMEANLIYSLLTEEKENATSSVERLLAIADSTNIDFFEGDTNSYRPGYSLISYRGSGEKVFYPPFSSLLFIYDGMKYHRLDIAGFNQDIIQNALIKAGFPLEHLD